MQEDQSSSSHEVSQLYRTKQHGPAGPPLEGAAVEGVVPPVSEGAPAVGLFKNFPSLGTAAYGGIAYGTASPLGAAREQDPGLSVPPCPLPSPSPSPLPSPALPGSTNPSEHRVAPLTFVANKYVLLDKVDGSSFFNCVDVVTREHMVCKVSDLDA